MNFVLCSQALARLSVTGMNFGERLAYSGRMMLLGTVTVFAALAILWGVLVLFRLCLVRAEKKKAPVSPAGNTSVQGATAPDDGELAAAIAAALALTLEAEGKPSSFRVVSYRKIQTESHKH